MHETDWAAIERIFADCLAEPPEARAAFLDRACADQPGLRAEVESLLASEAAAGSFLESPPAVDSDPGTTSRDWIGRRVGAFRLVERIGQGGMGVVFRAERDDGEFSQRAAVKLITTPLVSDDVLARFRDERQILASLNHPHIVSLLEGGLTDDGQPYLVMELVDGVPLTRYCDERAVSLEDRLRLAGQICSAVQYAHQHGVVHRDLKPANILVTADGTAKVLDFGIAKLVDPSAPMRDRTLTGLRPLTPNYASPEQLRGLVVTTASDIYALGVLLYELMAGARPYETAAKPLEEVLDVVAVRDPVRPSQSLAEAVRLPYDRRRLRGDLDAIVLKAMSKEPSRRYASAQELADDVDRWRSGRPVAARDASLRYVVGKVARRHRAAVGAALVSLVALLAALAISLWQTHVARLERARADLRFTDVRELANSLIFKIDDAVLRLPGGTPVRQLIVAEALKYLERLSRDPAGDDALRLELARGYHRIGDVQGAPNQPNLGDRAGSHASYQKAIALLRPLVEGAQPSRDALLMLGRVNLSMADALRIAGSREQARASIEQATVIADRLLGLNSQDAAALRLSGSASFQLAFLVGPPASLPHWQRAGEAFGRLLAGDPANADHKRNVALVEKYQAGYYETIPDYPRALDHHQRALTLDEQRLASAPASREAQFDVAIDLAAVAFVRWQTGALQEAADGYERSLRMRRQLADSDPKDMRARARVAHVHTQLAGVYVALRRPEPALAHAFDAVRLGEAMAAIDLTHQLLFAEQVTNLGRAHAVAGQRAPACKAFQRSQSILDAVLAKGDPGPDLNVKVRYVSGQLRDGLRSCGSDATRTPQSPSRY